MPTPPPVTAVNLELRAVPQRMLLFTGHRVDVPGRVPARFPQSQVAEVQAQAHALLASMHAGEHDLLLIQGSAGGDLICARAAVARGVPVVLIQPKPEPVFLAESVAASEGGDYWLQAYRELVCYPHCQRHTVAPHPEPFAYCNWVLLATALQFGAGRLHLLYLWDGQPAAGPGGTADLIAAAANYTRHLYPLHLPALLSSQHADLPPAME